MSLIRYALERRLSAISKGCRLLLALTAAAPALAGGLALASGPSLANGTSRVSPHLWTTDKEIHAVVPAGNLLYIGGEFTYVGPVTSHGVPLDAASGRPLPAFPQVDGDVTAAAPDGKGGWYIGGAFGQVGHASRRNPEKLHLSY